MENNEKPQPITMYKKMDFGDGLIAYQSSDNAVMLKLDDKEIVELRARIQMGIYGEVKRHESGRIFVSMVFLVKDVEGEDANKA